MKHITAVLLSVILIIQVVFAYGQPPTERVWLQEISVKDHNGVEVFNVLIGESIIVESSLRSTLYYNQSFVHIVQIKDQKGLTASLSWIEGKLLSKQEMTVRQSWVPDKAGHYTIEAFVWDSLELPGILSLMRTGEVNVFSDKESLPFDFHLQVEPQKFKMQRGTTVEIKVKVEQIAGEIQSVRLYTHNIPQGFNITLDQPFTGARPPYTQLVSISASSTMTTKAYTFDIRGESGSIYHIVPVQVMVVKEDLTS